MLAVGLIFAHVIGLLVTTGLDGSDGAGRCPIVLRLYAVLAAGQDLDLRNQFAVLRPEGGACAGRC